MRTGEDVTEQPEFDRPKPWVCQIIRPKYGKRMPAQSTAGAAWREIKV